MTFDFGGSDMVADTISAAQGLKDQLKAANGWSDAEAYVHSGISGMNGLSDLQETTTPAQWTEIRDWASAQGLTRFAYWAVNRDRPCPGGGVTSNCSGIDAGEPGVHPDHRGLLTDPLCCGRDRCGLLIRSRPQRSRPRPEGGGCVRGSPDVAGARRVVRSPHLQA